MIDFLINAYAIFTFPAVVLLNWLYAGLHHRRRVSMRAGVIGWYVWPAAFVCVARDYYLTRYKFPRATVRRRS